MPAWRDAWSEALYGESGFYRRNQPAAHFRTAPMVSDEFAAALARLARAAGLTSVTDVGAGGGELLTSLHRLDPGLHLGGIEIRPRPDGLPGPVAWRDELPDHLSGLVIANEWLDTVPAPVVEVDENGTPRIVLVEGGAESLGDPAGADDAAWLDRWWPLREPGQRAVVGAPRDEAARDLLRRLGHGLLLLVDYGHTREDRPFLGGIQCFRGGRQVPVVLDGSADVTASVAMDAVERASSGRRLTQAEALTRLGVVAPVGGSVEAMAGAAAVAELLDPRGLGSFHWVVAERGGVRSPLAR